jgi:probable rRNA maturation factor
MYEIIYEDVEPNEEYEKTIEQVLKECYKEEKLENSKLIITITLTTPSKIRKINNEYRQIDRATDVLSFPMFEKSELDKKIENNDFLYEDILGDIIISVEKVKEQAKEYGHSFERELSYMVVHGFYHLMGYDHIEEKDKVIMRPKEEKILNKLGITREK